MNEETRSYESILADNRQLLDSNEVLQLRVGQMRATIAEYQRADAVAAAMAKNNDVLRGTETRTYQTLGEDGEVRS